MIRKLTEKDRENLLEYLYKEPNYNIFPIGDIEAFGFDQDFQHIYGEFDDNEDFLSMMLFYRENVIYYSHMNKFNEAYLPIMKQFKFSHFSLKSELAPIVKDYLPDFKRRDMYFCEATKINPQELDADLDISVLKTEEQAAKLHSLLSSVEEFDTISQDVDVFVDGKMKSIKMGTTLLLEKDNKVVASVATVAETKKRAMVVGVATDKEYRNKGYASKLMLELMDMYINGKNKGLCLFYDNPKAGKIYLRLGFEYIGMWTFYQRIEA